MVDDVGYAPQISPPDAPPLQLTIAEQVQLVLSTVPDRLEFGWAELGAAAVVELALLDRIRSVPPTGLFRTKRELIVHDAADTGHPILDAALGVARSNDGPWRAQRLVIAAGEQVAPAVFSSLVRRGFVEELGRFPDPNGYLSVLPGPAVAAEITRLRELLSDPDSAREPRSKAFVDVVHNGDARFSGLRGPHALSVGGYPESSADAILTTLAGEVEAFPVDGGG